MSDWHHTFQQMGAVASSGSAPKTNYSIKEITVKQRAVNEWLTKHGFDSIPVNGVLDATTCGALVYVSFKYNEKPLGDGVYEIPVAITPFAECSSVPGVSDWAPTKSAENKRSIWTAIATGGLVGVGVLFALHWNSTRDPRQT